MIDYAQNFSFSFVYTVNSRCMHASAFHLFTVFTPNATEQYYDAFFSFADLSYLQHLFFGHRKFEVNLPLAVA